MIKPKKLSRRNLIKLGLVITTGAIVAGYPSDSFGSATDLGRANGAHMSSIFRICAFNFASVTSFTHLSILG